MSFTIANTNHPELIDRFKCIQRRSTHNVSKESCIYTTEDVQIHFPNPCSKIYIKLDMRIYDYGQELNKEVIVRLGKMSLVYCYKWHNNKVCIGNSEFTMEVTDWHTYYFVVDTKNSDTEVYIDGNKKADVSYSAYSDTFDTITLYKDIEVRNILISDKPFKPSAEVVEIPISSVTGWDPSGETSYAADEEGQTCSITMDETKLNELKTNYDISRCVCTGVIDRQGENLNGLGVMYGEEKKNVSISPGEHPFSIDNPFEDSNVIHLIAKKV